MKTKYINYIKEDIVMFKEMIRRYRVGKLMEELHTVDIDADDYNTFLKMNGMYDVNKGITGENWTSKSREEIIAELRRLGCTIKLV